jgi:hypothetical protein
VDLVLELALGEEGYDGTLRVAGDAGPLMPLRDITLTQSRLTFDFDFPVPQGMELIRVRLDYRDEALTGSYTDSVGDPDRVYFSRS